MSADAPLFTLEDADARLGVAMRMIDGGIFDRSAEIAEAILNAPEALDSNSPDRRKWLLRREAARFILDRSRLGLAVSREEILAVAADLEYLADNRYRLPNPGYGVQAAYWAARAQEQAGEYRQAVRLYSRVGGGSLPAGIEGDAAWRTSRCLRFLAEEIPYPGNLSDRRLRDRLLNRAIDELDRARLIFPVGGRRRETELELVALRLARREPQFVRDAAAEADVFIAGDASRDSIRARAVLLRGRAASLLGDIEGAAGWFQRVLEEENPNEADRREAAVALAVSLVELAETESGTSLLVRAAAALDQILAGPNPAVDLDDARVVKARILLKLEQPTAAVETLAPALVRDRVMPAALMAAGMAELARGRLAEAFRHFHPVSRPSNPDDSLRGAASREAALAAGAGRDFGLALAMNHQASRIVRKELQFSSLLAMEFHAMETILHLGRMNGPQSLSGDAALFADDADAALIRAEQRRLEGSEALLAALGRFFSGGGNPDTAFDLAVAAEAAHAWEDDDSDKLELAIDMIGHLRQRRPPGVSENVLASRQGEAWMALALAGAERIFASKRPDNTAINEVLAAFAAASSAFRDASSDGYSIHDSLYQGMVSMESGGFLIRLADRWEKSEWTPDAAVWRDEARRRVEASLFPFNQAVASAPPASPAARRARWGRGRALELLGDWSRAGADYLSLMNNSEFPRTLRTNAARRWGLCMGEAGDGRQALPRLEVFANNDAETALLAGKLAEASGNIRGACRHYLFAANSESTSLPPVTPGRTQESAFRAARLIFANPSEADPFASPDALIASARDLLLRYAILDLGGAWTVPMLELLAENLINSTSRGWRAALQMATEVLDVPVAPPAVQRAMRIIAARALTAGGRTNDALEDLDAAGELVGDDDASSRDAARITLETARAYRAGGRRNDAVRAFAEVFASHSEEREEADQARLEAAETIMFSAPPPGDREKEQVRGILLGLRDQMLAERLMREYGVR
jgi:tetratricopeptide (TPR) repeat protein